MAINIRTDKNYRSESSCTFCNGSHTITGCEVLKTEAETGEKLPFSKRTYRQHYAMQYVEAKANRSKKKASKTRKCGYCGTTGHTRRQCTVMEGDRELLIKANKIWRKLYAHYSIECGFAPASLIRHNEKGAYNYSQSRYEMLEVMYLIGSELPSNLSVFALSSDYSSRQDVGIPAVGRERKLQLQGFLKDADVKTALCGERYWYNTPSPLIITKSTYRYSEEWINGECEDIDFVLKKWNKERVEKDILGVVREKLIPFDIRFEKKRSLRGA